MKSNMPASIVTNVVHDQAVDTIHVNTNSREGCDHMSKCPMSMIVLVPKSERDATKHEENHQHWNSMHVFR